jgi:hypothetical protein
MMSVDKAVAICNHYKKLYVGNQPVGFGDIATLLQQLQADAGAKDVALSDILECEDNFYNSEGRLFPQLSYYAGPLSIIFRVSRKALSTTVGADLLAKVQRLEQQVESLKCCMNCANIDKCSVTPLCDVASLNYSEWRWRGEGGE